MVRVTHNSKTSARVAGCAPSHHTLKPLSTSSSTVSSVTNDPISRGAIDRARARADARESKRCAKVKAKLRSSRLGTLSTPAADLLNELPVRVREEVETIRNCCLACLPADSRHSDATPRFAAANIHKHQLFSKEHADNLDPEIRQWLPRLVCPAFPLSPKCHGQGQRSDSMLRHLEICKHFQALFPDEYKRLFPRTEAPRPPADDGYKVLKMTIGQLEFLSAKLGKECRGKKGTFVSMSPTTVRMILHSWRPLSKPGAEVVLPSEFPPIRIPQYFCAAGAEHATTEDERGESSGYEADFDTSESSNSNAPSPFRTPLAIIPDEEMQQDAPTPSPSSMPTPTPMPTPSPEPMYPELYLPPHLLPPTCDEAYLAAAIAAHAPEVDTFSPLLGIPFSSLSAEIPRDCSVSNVGVGSVSEYDLPFFSDESSGANNHTQDFHHIFHSWNVLPLAGETSLFSQPAESGLLSSQMFFA